MNFEIWLTMYWQPELRARPDRMADAFSPHGASGRGIDWFETPAAVFGRVAGVEGGYEIPVDAIRQALPRFEREHVAAAAREPIRVVD